MTAWLSDPWLHTLQAGLMLFGIWLALRILRHRLAALANGGRYNSLLLVPPLLFLLLVACFNLWLLSQPMIMRF
jgi:hypothetical protein